MEVITLLREAVAADASPIVHRLGAALDWIQASRLLRDPSRLDAYIQTFTLTDISVTRARSLETRLSNLTSDRMTGRLDGLAVDAASYSIEQGRLELAVELLEQGRATLFAQLGRYRTSLDHLRDINEDLAEEFKRLSWLLETSAVSGGEMPADTKSENEFEDVVARQVTNGLSS